MVFLKIRAQSMDESKIQILGVIEVEDMKEFKYLGAILYKHECMERELREKSQRQIDHRDIEENYE